MKTEWRGKVFDVRQSEVSPGGINLGDLWLRDSEYYEVVTIQPAWSLENLNHHFTMFTLSDRDGNIVPVRGDRLQGKQTVLKKTKKVIFV